MIKTGFGPFFFAFFQSMASQWRKKGYLKNRHACDFSRLKEW